MLISLEPLLPGHNRRQQASIRSQRIKRVVAQMESEDGWVPLGQLGNHLANLVSDFELRTFHSRKLSDLVWKTNEFEIDQRRNDAYPCEATALPDDPRQRPASLPDLGKSGYR